MRDKMIIDFYEDGKLPVRIKIKIWLKMIKENIKNEFRRFDELDRTRNSTVSTNGDNNTRTSKMYKETNDEVKDD